MRHALRLAFLFGVLASASLNAGCVINRGALTAPPPDAAGIDAMTFDAFVVPGTDAWREEPDVFVEPPDAVEVPVDATQCDSVGDPCCGGSCTAGLVCMNDGTCGSACGDIGIACCYTGFCRGSGACGPSGLCVPCGERDGPCCAAASCLAPEANTCVDGTCVACGALGGPCCGGSCAGLDCVGGVCRAAEGQLGGPCRPPSWSGARCDGSACRDGICVECGRSGQPCCDGRCAGFSICLVTECS